MSNKQKETPKEVKKETPKAKKYFIVDKHDRFFPEVDLELKAGKAVEIPEKTAETLKKKFPYLEITEK